MLEASLVNLLADLLSKKQQIVGCSVQGSSKFANPPADSHMVMNSHGPKQ